jgi:predicted Fe-Mo cluster-binding NifX family protein
MFIMIGSDGIDLESSVAKRFGHASYYILYNTVTKNFTVEENSQEEHNHDNLYYYLDKGVEAFIVGNIGPHAFQIINTPDSKVYLARKMSVLESIEKFLAGELEHLSEPTVRKSIGHDHKGGEHHMGRGHGRKGGRRGNFD